MAIARDIYSEDHSIFRDQVRRFMEEEVAPHHEQWEKDGVVPKALWEKAGANGMLCCDMPEEYGGPGADFLAGAIVVEELMRVGATGPGFSLHSDIVAPYILHYGSEEQKKKWLPKMATGECVTAIAMTEPGTGSDLQGVRTKAEFKGNHYVLNGQKTFITNGQNADLAIIVAKTDPAQGAKGTSLFLVEADREGFSKGRNLEKIGLKAQDTSELFFENVELPPEALLGEENQGFAYLMQELPRERLTVGIMALSASQAALGWTIDYVRERKAFGKSVMDFQNTRFKLAELKAEIEVGQVFLDKCLALQNENQLDVETAAICKLWTTELQCKVMDECLQLHGGYGYMWEYPIARAWADSRVQKIYAGTNEIMKELISRTL